MDVQDFVDVLSALRADSLAIQSDLTDGNIRMLMQMHNVVFLGENANEIYAVELYQALNARGKIAVSLPDFLSLVPSACAALGMQVEGLMLASNKRESVRPVVDYIIHLH